jgi:hypothetical protein
MVDCRTVNISILEVQASRCRATYPWLRKKSKNSDWIAIHVHSEHNEELDILQLYISNAGYFTSVDPVKATLVISGCAVTAAPAVGP